MSGECSVPGAPDWVSYASYHSGSCDTGGCAGLGKALSIAGIPPLVNDRVLTCCGRVYGEAEKGLLYEGLSSPPLYSFPVNPIDQRQWPSTIGLFERCRSSSGMSQYVFSPLGWPTHSLLRLSEGRGPRGCVSVDGFAFAPSGLEPLQLNRIAGCTELEFNAIERVSFSLGVFDFEVEGGVGSTSNVVGVESDNKIFFYDKRNNSITIYSKNRSFLKMRSVLGEYVGSALAYFRMHPFAGSSGTVESVAITIGLGSKRIAIGSSKPVKVEYYPGGLEIHFEDSIRITSGGSLTAVRLAVEDAVTLDAKEACGKGLGHLRASTSVIALSGLDRESLFLVAYSPVSQGLGELRTRFPIRSVLVREDCNEETSFSFLPDLLRIPMPLGCYCLLNVKRGFLLLRK